jgi:hypothetical protein
MNLTLIGNRASLGAGLVTLEQSPGKNHQSGQKDNIHSCGSSDLLSFSLAEEYQEGSAGCRPGEILGIFKKIGMELQEAFQTLFQPPPDVRKKEDPRRGFGQGGFVVLKAMKKS